MRADQFSTRIERKLVASLAFICEAIDLALEGDLGLDGVDTVVAVDQVDAAGRHAMKVLWIVRPDLVTQPDEAVASTLNRLAKRYGVRLKPGCEDRTKQFTAVLCAAFNACLEARDVARWARRRPRMSEAIEELEAAASHLENVFYLMDPQMFRRAIEDAPPDERVRLASTEEAVELAIEENRAMVRSRRLGTRKSH
jgi:hypothetical protein